MGKQSVGQIMDRSILERFADLALEDAAASAFSLQFDRDQEELVQKVKRITGRDATATHPYNGWVPRCEVDRVLFQLGTDDDKGKVFMVITCPTCTIPGRYPVRTLTDIGATLANAAKDDRCSACVKHAFEAKRVDEYGAV